MKRGSSNSVQGFVRRDPLRIAGLIALASATLYAQPTGGPVYWSATRPDCSSLAGQSAVAVADSSGAPIGYSCYVSGTFVWLASGGGWATSIRVAAPSSGAIGVDLTFYDTGGNSLVLDHIFGSGSLVTSSDGLQFALSANQPAEVALLGATSGAPQHKSTSTGSAYAVFYCPDAATCSNVLTQLLYSALPMAPWSLSVPISWDTELWTEWSAHGVDNGGTQRVSLAIYNEDIVATSYTVRVYDSTGTLAGIGTTPVIPALQSLGNDTFGQGGTYGAMLSDVISTPLPSGIFKILVDGGSKYCAVQVFQFNGPSATASQVVYDGAPGSSRAEAAQVRPHLRTPRAATPRSLFHPLMK